MFGKIRERVTKYFSALALINAAAFTGFITADVEEIVVTARKNQKVYKMYQSLYQRCVKAILKRRG